MFYFGAVVLILLLVLFWISNLFGIPGNWVNLALAGLWMWLAWSTELMGFTWITLVVIAVLATLGEVLEFAAGAMGTSVVGGSKRSGALAMLFSLIGGFVGLFIGLPIPIVGSLVAALLFACIGALAGGVLGEYWKEGDWKKSFQVGHAAFWARLLGTLAKIVCGALIVVVAAAALFFAVL